MSPTLPTFTPSVDDVADRDALLDELNDPSGVGCDAIYRSGNAGAGVLVKLKVSAQEAVGKLFRGGLSFPAKPTQGGATGQAEGVVLIVPRGFSVEGDANLGTVDLGGGNVGVLEVRRGDSFEVNGEAVGRSGTIVRLLASMDGRSVAGHINAHATIAATGGGA